MTMKEKLVTIFCSVLSVEPDFSNAEAMEFVEGLIAHGVTVQEWISVKDRLPDADGDYLVWNDYHKAIVGHYWSKGRYFISKAVTVTHWMPLPQPPKGE